MLAEKPSPLMAQRVMSLLNRTWSRIRAHPGLWLALAAGLTLKVVLIATGSITFDSDEAIVALMARHITQGEWPIFFYGQSYMGALDAYLIAGGFRILGESVTTVRVVQTILFAGVVVTTYTLTLKLSGKRGAATGSALLAALPPVLVGLYTTSTLGDYVELLVIGNLLLLLGWRMAESEGGGPLWVWVTWGLLAGVGWWSMAFVVLTATPSLAYVLFSHRKQFPFLKFVAMAAGGLLGAAPWLLATFRDGALSTISAASGAWLPGELAGTLATAWDNRLLNLAVFNLPALFGLRPPWSLDWIMLPLGLALVWVYLAAGWRALRSRTGQPTYTRRLTLVFACALLAVLFVLTPFGVDPTGRYMLPMYPSLAALVADWLWSWGEEGQFSSRLSWFTAQRAARAVLALMLAYNVWGTVRAMRDNPPGLTTQWDLISHIPHDHDDELLAFLDAQEVSSAYTNYWVTYRFAFLTGEQLHLAPRLPYKADMSYTTADNRIPAYTVAVDASPEVVYITTNHPQLDTEIARRFDALGVEYREIQIGPYHVFYELSRPVRPLELGAFGETDYHGD